MRKLVAFFLLLSLVTACGPQDDDIVILPLDPAERLVFGTFGGWFPVTYQVFDGQLYRLEGYFPTSLSQTVGNLTAWEVVGTEDQTATAVQLAANFPQVAFQNLPVNQDCPGIEVDGNCFFLARVIPAGHERVWVRYEGDDPVVLDYRSRLENLVVSLWE